MDRINRISQDLQDLLLLHLASCFSCQSCKVLLILSNFLALARLPNWDRLIDSQPAPTRAFKL